MYCAVRAALGFRTVALHAGLAKCSSSRKQGLVLDLLGRWLYAHWLAATLAHALVLHCNGKACTGAVHLSPFPGSLTPAHVSRMSGLQWFALTRRTRVTPGSHDTMDTGKVTQLGHHWRPPCRGIAAAAQSDWRELSRPSHSLAPPLASRLVLSARRRSATPANHPSLSICPQQSPRRRSSPTVPCSLCPSTSWDSSVCRFAMNPYFFLRSAHLNVPSCPDLPLGIREASRR